MGHQLNMSAVSSEKELRQGKNKVRQAKIEDGSET